MLTRAMAARPGVVVIDIAGSQHNQLSLATRAAPSAAADAMAATLLRHLAETGG
ncbi:hypothetical protein [Tsukamurella soli]|uniref:hypothetical protein n=1 Tax=Tsukamurella soli TaxID=644556 RepID=UPI003621C0BB